MYFHEYFIDFDGDFGAFDKSGSYNFVPNKRPPFSLFSKRPGRLKGRIRKVTDFSPRISAGIPRRVTNKVPLTSYVTKLHASKLSCICQ